MPRSLGRLLIHVKHYTLSIRDRPSFKSSQLKNKENKREPHSPLLFN